MRIVGFCPDCGASIDGEFNASGGGRVIPVILCECAGLAIGLRISRLDGKTPPALMTLIEIPAGIDVDE